jgi:protein gp37
MIFVGSMMDLFHPELPDSYIEKVFKVMRDCPHHIFQVLIKRPERASLWQGPWVPNIWIGTTVEHHKTISRIDILRRCPADVRFISFEPLIGPVGEINFRGIHWAIVADVHLKKNILALT